ncbi:MAG: AraC family transcriptional regulator [Rhizobiaceae bacterium]
MSGGTDLVSLADQFQILASVGRDLPRYCAEAGIDLDVLAGQFGIDPATFDDFDTRISFDRFSRLLDAIASVTGDDTFGLKFGMVASPGAAAPFGFGLAVAPDFTELIRFYAKYVHIVVDLDIFNAIIESDRITLEWSYSPLIGHSEQYADYAAAVAMRVLGRYLGRLKKPLRVQLQRRPPRDKSLHMRLISPSIRFGADINRFVFSPAVLGRPNMFADPSLFRYMTQRCEEMSARLRRKKDIVTALKEDFVRELETGVRSIGELSRKYGMSERSLQRRLAERGTGFGRLVEQTREELALQMLQETETPLIEIGHRLGYSSQSSFTRAIKRLHGRTPGEIRRQYKGPFRRRKPTE